MTTIRGARSLTVSSPPNPPKFRPKSLAPIVHLLAERVARTPRQGCEMHAFPGHAVIDLPNGTDFQLSTEELRQWAHAFLTVADTAEALEKEDASG